MHSNIDNISDTRRIVRRSHDLLFGHRRLHWHSRQMYTPGSGDVFK